MFFPIWNWGLLPPPPETSFSWKNNKNFEMSPYKEPSQFAISTHHSLLIHHDLNHNYISKSCFYGAKRGGTDNIFRQYFISRYYFFLKNLSIVLLSLFGKYFLLSFYTTFPSDQVRSLLSTIVSSWVVWAVVVMLSMSSLVSSLH